LEPTDDELQKNSRGLAEIVEKAVDGDTLTICDNAPNLDKPRPTAFEAKSGSGYDLITFKGAKP
jgi:hypothetical protein